MPVNVTDEDEWEPTDEEMARLDELQTHWDRPDVKALLEQQDLEEAEPFWQRPDVHEILEQWDLYANLNKPDK